HWTPGSRPPEAKPCLPGFSCNDRLFLTVAFLSCGCGTTLDLPRRGPVVRLPCRVKRRWALRAPDPPRGSPPARVPRPPPPHPPEPHNTPGPALSPSVPGVLPPQTPPTLPPPPLPPGGVPLHHFPQSLQPVPPPPAVQPHALVQQAAQPRPRHGLVARQYPRP